MIRLFQRMLGLVALLAFAAGGRAATNDPPSFFGLTNLWTLHLTMTPEDWQTLGSRGVVQRNPWGGGGGGNDDGMVARLLRGYLGGDSQGSSAAGGPGDCAKYPWVQCTVEAAGERVVDRLLASEQHGVRYGRHWLDVLRYADFDENMPSIVCYPTHFPHRDENR